MKYWYWASITAGFAGIGLLAYGGWRLANGESFGGPVITAGIGVIMLFSWGIKGLKRLKVKSQAEKINWLIKGDEK